VAAAPAIRSVDGPVWDWDKAPRYRYYLEADYYDNANFNWTINGSGFGPNSGTVSLPSGYTARILSWSDTQIRIRPTSSINATPVGSAVVTVIGSNRQQATFRIRGVLPSVFTRAYAQCTWWTAQQRILAGRGISGGFNGGAYATNVRVDGNYAPAVRDVLMFGTLHQAFIESLGSAKVEDDKRGTRTITYALTISQYNARYDEVLSRYDTVHRVRETYDPRTSRVTRRSLINAPKFSSNSSAATGAWR
jgi:hypothetical protein